MTLHIPYTHQCARCSAFYIPYAPGVVCPSCGVGEDELFETFIEEAARSARYNLYVGSYVPGAWWVGSFADHVLHVLFVMLEKHRTDEAGRPFEKIAREAVDAIHFGDQQYLREHVYDIALKVKQELDQAET